MAREYVPIFYDWVQVTAELTADEKGRLIDAIVIFAQGGDWQAEIKGNERFLFPAFKAQIERTREANGNKSAAAFTREQKKRDVAQKAQNTTESTDDHKDHKIPNNNNKEYITTPPTTRAREEESEVGPVEIDPLIVLVQSEITGMTYAHYDELESYRKDLPDDLIEEAINEAVANGVRQWAYVRKVLTRYVQQGIRTVAEARAQKRQREAKGNVRDNDNPRRAGDDRQKSEYDYLAVTAV